MTTILELSEALRNKKVSSLEATKECLKKLEGNRFNSMIHIADEYAIEAAKKSDKKLAAGLSGILLGVPIVIKDNISVARMPLTCGSRAVNITPDTDAEIIKRLIDAGAVILGKANMDEFAMGGSGETSVFGAAKNPHDTACTAGGSSGGSAAALAAGECYGSFGTDTGGSIRLPAAFCGVVGFKPTHNSVSNQGIIPVAKSLDQVGTFAKTVADTALLINAVSNMSIDVSLGLDLRGLKIGIIKEFLSVKTSEKISTAFESCIKQLESCGVKIVEFSMPFDTQQLYKNISYAEIALSMAGYSGYGDEVQRRARQGQFLLESEIPSEARRLRASLAQQMEEVLETCTAIISPSSPMQAFKIGQGLNSNLGTAADVFLRLANLAYLPAISIPIKMSEGLPIGIQLIGGRNRDEKLLQLANALEKEFNA